MSLRPRAQPVAAPPSGDRSRLDFVLRAGLATDLQLRRYEPFKTHEGLVPMIRWDMESLPQVSWAPDIPQYSKLSHLHAMPPEYEGAVTLRFVTEYGWEDFHFYIGPGDKVTVKPNSTGFVFGPKDLNFTAKVLMNLGTIPIMGGPDKEANEKLPSVRPAIFKHLGIYASDVAAAAKKPKYANATRADYARGPTQWYKNDIDVFKGRFR